jgi:hypothetical protein
VPLEQTCPFAQALPQAPQLARSLCRSRHAPPHSVCPSRQLTTHAPRSQMRPLGQALPQAPQLARSLCGSAQ